MAPAPGLHLERCIHHRLPLHRPRSIGVERRIAERYVPMARALGAPAADLRPHPSESEIVAEALAHHAGRLVEQLRSARPDVVVTLGNAAGRVVAALAGLPEHDGILRPYTYGAERPITLGGRTFAWRALVHPATPKVWAERHGRWTESMGLVRRGQIRLKLQPRWPRHVGTS